MTENTMTCPHCGQEFPMTQALSHQLKDELEGEVRKKLEEDMSASLKDLHDQLEVEKKKRQEAEASELSVRKERIKLQEEKEEWELIKERELNEERESIREKAISGVLEKQQLKERETQELIENLRNQIKNLNQKIEQGSQQIQGEILELVLEDFLKEKFPLDEIVPVPKGTKGADILHKVHNEKGRPCGTIIWETKRTKTWNDQWCEKLKEDQQIAGADVSILVSTSLPKDVKNFAHKNGIWVTEQAYILGLVTAIRISLIRINAVQNSAEDRGSKIEDLYKYFTSPEFNERVNTIVESFTTMKKDLDDEKRAIQKLWNKREKQIEKVVEKTLQIQGHLEAIIGRPMLQIEQLELASLAAGSEFETNGTLEQAEVSL